MKINDVFILEEAVDDMDEGKDFYNLREHRAIAYNNFVQFTLQASRN